jgi:hypothetical protein
VVGCFQDLPFGRRQERRHVTDCRNPALAGRGPPHGAIRVPHGNRWQTHTFQHD